MKYPYLLFDADDTLFDFPRACRPGVFHYVPDERRSGHAGHPAPSTTGSTWSCGQPLTGAKSPRTM